MVLLAQDLPAECSEVVLGMLFQQNSGYREVRVPRPGIAFVEFVDEPHATIARRAMNGFKLTPTTNLHVIYAKNP
jgi:U2 small nuclear ribonucleoprotein B''